MQSIFKKKVPHIWGKAWRNYVLSSYFFPFLIVSFVTFVVQTMTFEAKLSSLCVLIQLYSMVMKLSKLF